MFTVGDYKIVFSRQWHERGTDINGKYVYGSGRYDTVCEITDLSVCSDWEENHFTGVAKLHPNDQVDQIVGKKLALKRALDAAWPFDDSGISGTVFEMRKHDAERKFHRTEIWKAFWQWVANWSNQAISLENNNESHRTI